MKRFFKVLALSVIFINNAYAYDNGPQVLACDYKLGDIEGTEICLIEGSGVNQGMSWVVFELMKKKYRHYSSSPNKIQHIDSSGKVVAEYPIKNFEGQCRPGGRDADVYEFNNGDRICIYW